MTHEVIIKDDGQVMDAVIREIQNNVSAVSLIAEYLDMEEDVVRANIMSAAAEGRIQGKFSDDESRFYRSDVKMPDPSSITQEEVIETPSLLIPKAITLGGILLFIAGQILIRMATEGTSLHNISAMLVFGGIFTVFGGLYAFSRFGTK